MDKCQRRADGRVRFRLHQLEYVAIGIFEDQHPPPGLIHLAQDRGSGRFESLAVGGDVGRCERQCGARVSTMAVAWDSGDRLALGPMQTDPDPSELERRPPLAGLDLFHPQHVDIETQGSPHVANVVVNVLDAGNHGLAVPCFWPSSRVLRLKAAGSSGSIRRASASAARAAAQSARAAWASAVSYATWPGGLPSRAAVANASSASSGRLSFVNTMPRCSGTAARVGSSWAARSRSASASVGRSRAS